MIEFSSKYRSRQSEIMDDFNFHGNELELLLTDLKFVNKWLGGNKITAEGIAKLLKHSSEKETITILDIGCGDGELLRSVTEFGAKNGLKIIGIGVDFNENIIEIAKARSKVFPNLSYIKQDVFSDSFTNLTYDIALCTLFLHHFSNERIVKLLTKLTKGANLGVVVNDLQRNRFAFWLFKVFGAVFLETKTARHDGLVSIARGFTRKELLSLSEAIPDVKATVYWRWAFRYQWNLRRVQ